MSDIRFNQWLHQSGTGGITQVDGGHVGIGTTNPDIAVHTANTKKVNVGIVTANSVYAGSLYGDGSNISALNASNIASGTVPVARIGTGTKNTSTFYRGDGAFATVTSTTINNNADNRVITGSGTANTLNGESELTYNGSGLLSMVSTGSNSKIKFQRTGTSIGGHIQTRDESNDKGLTYVAQDGNSAKAGHVFITDQTSDGSSPQERLRINSTGNVSIGGIDPVATASAYDKASLHIHQTNSGSNKGSQIHLTTDHTGSAAGDGIQISAYSTSLYINNQENGDTYFFNNGSPTATIKANGSFGIGTQAPTDKLHVNGTTNLGGNTYLTNAYVSGNIYIGGSGSANQFDDYEKGTWTPTINVGTYTTFITNTYIKIGKLVYLHGGLIFHNNSSGTAVQITNIPYTQDTSQHMGIVWLRRTSTDNKSWKMLLGENGTNVLSVHRDSNGNDMGANLTYSQFQHSSTYFNYSITYRTTQ